MYVRAGFLCTWDQTLPLSHWNQGSEMKLGIRQSNYMYKYNIHCSLACSTVVQLQLWRVEVNWCE